MRKGRPLAEGAGPLFLIAGGQWARICHMAVFLRLRLDGWCCANFREASGPEHEPPKRETPEIALLIYTALPPVGRLDIVGRGPAKGTPGRHPGRIGPAPPLSYWVGRWAGRTSENASSTHFVNKGKKRKGRGCYYAPAR